MSAKVSTSFRCSFSMERNAGKVYRDVFGLLVLFGGISRKVHFILIISRLSAIFLVFFKCDLGQFQWICTFTDEDFLINLVEKMQCVMQRFSLVVIHVVVVVVVVILTLFDVVVVAVVLLAVFKLVYGRIRYWIIVSLLNMIGSIYIYLISVKTKYF